MYEYNLNYTCRHTETEGHIYTRKLQGWLMKLPKKIPGNRGTVKSWKMIFTEVENKKENYRTKYTWNHLLKKVGTVAMAVLFPVCITGINSNWQRKYLDKHPGWSTFSQFKQVVMPTLISVPKKKKKRICKVIINSQNARTRRMTVGLKTGNTKTQEKKHVQWKTDPPARSRWFGTIVRKFWRHICI